VATASRPYSECTTSSADLPAFLGPKDAYNDRVLVEIVFLMLVLKLPIIYLVAVVYWAVRAEPRPPEPAVLPIVVDRDPHDPRPIRSRGPRRGGPHNRGRPARRAERVGAR
jgi:hypothetical protein